MEVELGVVAVVVVVVVVVVVEGSWSVAALGGPPGDFASHSHPPEGTHRLAGHSYSVVCGVWCVCVCVRVHVCVRVYVCDVCVCDVCVCVCDVYVCGISGMYMYMLVYMYNIMSEIEKSLFLREPIGMHVDSYDRVHTMYIGLCS